MTKQSTALKTVSPAKTTDTVKKAAPRVKAATHRTTRIKSEKTPAANNEVAAPEIGSNEAIAALAYGFWAERGYRDGDPVADWLRAEAVYRREV